MNPEMKFQKMKTFFIAFYEKLTGEKAPEECFDENTKETFEESVRVIHELDIFEDSFVYVVHTVKKTLKHFMGDEILGHCNMKSVGMKMHKSCADENCSPTALFTNAFNNHEEFLAIFKEVDELKDNKMNGGECQPDKMGALLARMILAVMPKQPEPTQFIKIDVTAEPEQRSVEEKRHNKDSKKEKRKEEMKKIKSKIGKIFDKMKDEAEDIIDEVKIEVKKFKKEHGEEIKEDFKKFKTDIKGEVKEFKENHREEWKEDKKEFKQKAKNWWSSFKEDIDDLIN